MKLDSLKQKLKDWTDQDIAAHYLAVCLGVVEDYDGSFRVDHKWMYWTNNEYGNTLYDILSQMEKIGFLEYDDEEQRYRTNPEFEIVPPPPKTD